MVVNYLNLYWLLAEFNWVILRQYKIVRNVTYLVLLTFIFIPSKKCSQRPKGGRATVTH